MAEVDFLQPDENRDFALLVEGTKVYVNRGFLACYSSVLRKIFYPEGSPFKQPDGDGGMVMKDKMLDEFVQFLKAVFPTSEALLIDESNVAVLLAYADEYDVEVLRQRCVKFMDEQLRKGYAVGAWLIDFLRLACLYNLDNMQKQLVPLVAQLSINQLEAAEVEETLPLGVLAAIFYSKARLAPADAVAPMPEAFLCYGCGSNMCGISNGVSSCCNDSVYILAEALPELERDCSFTCASCSTPCSPTEMYGLSYISSCCDCGCDRGVFVYLKCITGVQAAADFSAHLISRKL